MFTIKTIDSFVPDIGGRGRGHAFVSEKRLHYIGQNVSKSKVKMFSKLDRNYLNITGFIPKT